LRNEPLSSNRLYVLNAGPESPEGLVGNLLDDRIANQMLGGTDAVDVITRPTPWASTTWLRIACCLDIPQVQTKGVEDCHRFLSFV